MTRLASMTLVLLLVAGAARTARAQGAPAPVTVPDVKGPIAVSAESWPLMASDRLQVIVDLPAAGYVEEEFFVSGRANVYDRAPDGSVVVRTPDAPFTTRLLLRRPADPARFSGTVVVEIGNVGRGYDFSFSWGVSHQHFLESGDAWVGITYHPENVAALKVFDPARYSPLSMPNPVPAEACAVGNAAPAAAAMEEGLRWDIISQVGALLKAARPGGPMAGFSVQRVFGTSHGGELATYIALFHPRARLAGGRPVYDGYIQHRHPALTRLRRCGSAPAADDPRQVLRNIDVPVIRVVAQTDVILTHARRREDSDTPGDQYRLYEVAGAPHADSAFYPYMPTVADQKRTGFDAFLHTWPFPELCQIEIPLLRVPVMTHALNAAWANLTRWVRDGVAAPRAQRIAVDNPNTPQARVVLDEHGNAVGGVRTPYVDVPTATYLTSTPGPGTCRNLAHKRDFDWATLNRLYGTAEGYARKVAESVDRLVGERWLTAADGRRINSEIAVAPATSSR